MKFFFTLIIVCIGLLLSAKTQGQSMNPDPNGVYCPLQTITFSVTLPVGPVWSHLDVSGFPLIITGANGNVLNTRGANVSSQISNIQHPNNTTTTFSFTGSFNDDNTPQSFRVTYVINAVNHFYDVTYYKIQSFKEIYPAYSKPDVPPSVTVPRCQTTSFNINFPNVDFVSNNPITTVNPQTIVKFGTITQYQYQLPVGWSLNGITSTGGNWINGTNNVTIIPDPSHGDQEYIQVRPVHPCGSSLAPPPQSQIAISRPAPILSITSGDGNYSLCSGSKDFTVSGLPAGATVSWTITNAALVSIPAPPNNISPTITVTKVGNNGIAMLTATVTSCSFTYTISKNISVGGPSGGVIQSYTNAIYCDTRSFQILASTGFYAYSGIINIVDGAEVAGQYTWSYEGPPPASMNWIDNGNGSVTVSSKTSNKELTLKLRMSNDCGFISNYFYFSSGPCIFSIASTQPAPSVVTDLELADSILSKPIKDGSLTIFPNPATSMLIISGKMGSQKALQYTVNIFDATGVLKRSQKNNGQVQMQLDIKELPAGMYIVELKNETGKRAYKIIKR